jgi:hypothetical protein
MKIYSPALTLSLATLLLAPLAAQADEYPGEGAYLVLSGIGGISTKDARSDLSSGGLGVRAGGFAFPYFAFEMQYDWVNDLAHLLTINVRGQPLTGRIQPFAAVGVGFTSLANRDLYGIWRAGGGVDFYLNDSWKLTADTSYVTTMLDGTVLRHVVVGLGVGMVF